MRLYATAADYEADGYGTAPANIDLLIRQASRTVDKLLVGKVYDVDDDGMPTGADDVQALTDATCAIAAECAASGVFKAGQAQGYNAVGIGNVSLSGPTLREGCVSVDGVPVPPAALVALSEVGRTVVYAPTGGYVRPLDRIT